MATHHARRQGPCPVSWQGDTAVPGSRPLLLPPMLSSSGCVTLLCLSCCSAHVLPPLSSPLLYPTWTLLCQHGTIFVWRLCHLLAKLGACSSSVGFPSKVSQCFDPVMSFLTVFCFKAHLLLGSADPLQDFHRTLGALSSPLISLPGHDGTTSTGWSHPCTLWSGPIQVFTALT